MTWHVQSGWIFSPKRRKETNTETNLFYVGIAGVENEDELPERVRRKLKRQFKKLLRDEGITAF